jgi:hypothetical protein
LYPRNEGYQGLKEPGPSEAKLELASLSTFYI